VALALAVAGCSDDSGQVQPAPDDTCSGDCGAADVNTLDVGSLDSNSDGVTPDIEREPDVVLQQFGEPCASDDECESQICLQGDRDAFCTQRCAGECPDDFECRLVTAGGADILRICVPRIDRLCLPCDEDQDCGAGSYCIGQDNGEFCANDCSVTRTCPENFFCNAATIPGAGSGGGLLETFICEPAIGECRDCLCNLPNTVDWTCNGSECIPVECANGWDNCDGLDDTGCETPLTLTRSCGTSCADVSDCLVEPGAEEASCVVGECIFPLCQEGRLDCNDDPGCETQLGDITACGTSCDDITDCRRLRNVSDAVCEVDGCAINRCRSGWGDCEGGAVDGCETDLDDVTSCGSNCGDMLDCTTLPHVADAICRSGCIILACEPGWDHQNGGSFEGLSDGCETPID